MVCSIDGRARALLSAERPALNFLQLLSGTATATREVVRAVQGASPNPKGCAVLDTRKTLPGLRLAQKYAVRVGGADLSVQASPAKFTYCYAENLVASPWPGLHADQFDESTSSVTVLKCEGPRTFVSDSSTTAEDILAKAAGNIAGMGGNLAAMVRAQVMVTLNPGHAAIIARELGIPAVVGCGNATMLLKTGDRVRVDGGRGTVEIITS